MYVNLETSCVQQAMMFSMTGMQPALKRTTTGRVTRSDGGTLSVTPYEDERPSTFSSSTARGSHGPTQLSFFSLLESPAT